jgi:hypothetical protein
MRDAEIVLAGGDYAPGECVDGQIVVRNDKPFKCNRVDVSLFGQEVSRVEHGSGEDRHVHEERRTHINYAMPLWGPGEVPAGETRFDFSFILPMGIPPTYAGWHGSVTYVLKGKVEMPRAFDLNPSKSIQVAWLPQPAIAERRTESIEHAGIHAMYIEVENDIIGPGVSIPLRFILYGEAKCRGIRLQILRCEAVAPEGCSEKREGTVDEAYYRRDDLHLNLWTLHVFSVHGNLPPPFKSELIQLEYKLKVTLDIPWGADEAISIPLR